MKFRKKPVVIEAWQWLFGPGQLDAPYFVTDALNRWPKENGVAFWPDGNFKNEEGEWARKPHIEIKTLEGVMRATPGDWIIKGVKGGLYPCKPDIFDATYEPINEGSQP